MKPPMIVNEDLVEQGFRTDIPSPEELAHLVASRVVDEESMLFVPDLTPPTSTAHSKPRMAA